MSCCSSEIFSGSGLLFLAVQGLSLFLPPCVLTGASSSVPCTHTKLHLIVPHLHLQQLNPTSEWASSPPFSPLVAPLNGCWCLSPGDHLSFNCHHPQPVFILTLLSLCPLCPHLPPHPPPPMSHCQSSSQRESCSAHRAFCPGCPNLSSPEEHPEMLLKRGVIRGPPGPSDLESLGEPRNLDG